MNENRNLIALYEKTVALNLGNFHIIACISCMFAYNGDATEILFRYFAAGACLYCLQALSFYV